MKIIVNTLEIPPSFKPFRVMFDVTNEEDYDSLLAWLSDADSDSAAGELWRALNFKRSGND